MSCKLISTRLITITSRSNKIEITQQQVIAQRRNVKIIQPCYKLFPFLTLTRPIHRCKSPRTIVMHRRELNGDAKYFHLQQSSIKYRWISQHKDTTKGTHRGRIHKRIKAFWTEFTDKPMIKILTLRFLQTNNRAFTFLNFSMHNTLSRLRIKPSHIPAQNPPFPSTCETH
jgi:hypothetical protein